MALPAAKFFEQTLEKAIKRYKIKGNRTIFISLTLEKIMTKEALKETLMKKHKSQLAQDTSIINNYLKENDIVAQTTPSGLQYIIDKPCQEGALLKQGNIVKIHYTGRLLNEKIFDTSIVEVAKENNCFSPQRPYEPIAFPLGVGYVIQGWDEGIFLFKKGEKGRLFIPSLLAYGEQEAGSIPPHSILIFEIEVVDTYKE